MRYVSVKDVRLYNGWLPVEEKRQPLKKIGETVFQTPHAPLVDADWDGSVYDDVIIYLDGEHVEPESIDPSTGLVSIHPPPSPGASVEADYFWHPIGDEDIILAVEAAEGLVEALTGVVYVPHQRVERRRIERNGLVALSEPVITIQSIKLYDSFGNFLGEAEATLVDRAAGILKIRVVSQEPRPPWYLPSYVEAEVEYVGGHESVPATVKNAVLALASHNLLTRFQQRLALTPDYGGGVSTVFVTEDLEKRLRFLRSEVEKTVNSLPRRVEKA
ncbi:MAG: hypothetical protein QXS96_02715 [Candidatus Caldarchaeum sp.]|uniref:Uncharacterized protein n=1 Tax=Caldiarchaeum subterraneum TaxID=311458 RepID=A0A7J3WAY8_CALS0|nr:hypothetical protein [Candidatus Caldarchaeales archaeon]